MPGFFVNRRAFLAAAAAAFVSSAAAAQSRRGARLIIDVSPLVARQQGELAGNIRPLLEQAIGPAAAAAGPRLGGVTVIVRVTSMQFAMYGGADNVFMGPMDSASADVIVQSGRTVLLSRPISVTAPAFGGGPAEDPRSEWRRAETLVNAIAYWAVRALPR